MPLEREEDFGSNADGSQNKEYCCYCFTKGKFSDPDLTLPQYLDKVEEIMKGMQMPDDVIIQTRAMIPQLKRWKTKAKKTS